MPLDVQRNFLAEIAFDRTLVFEDLTDVVHLILSHVADLLIRIDAGPVQQALCASPPDPVNISESDLSPLFRRQIYARDTCHIPVSSSPCVLLTLPLLVFGVSANDPNHTFAVDQFALVANFL